jgi:hypothetical protein
MRNIFLVALHAAVIVAATSVSATTNQYQVRAYIDGRDLLSIQGGTMQWHHLEFAAVGRWSGANNPTIISSWSNGVPTCSDENWYPAWPESPPAEIRYVTNSSVYTALSPILPAQSMAVTLGPVQARALFSIYQYPVSSNNYTMILDFDDSDMGNPTIGYAAWYDINVQIISPVPAPRFQSITRTNNSINLIWDAQAGATYQVLYATNLNPIPIWSPLCTLTATNSIGVASDGAPVRPQRFYRLVVQ